MYVDSNVNKWISKKRSRILDFKEKRMYLHIYYTLI